VRCISPKSTTAIICVKFFMAFLCHRTRALENDFYELVYNCFIKPFSFLIKIQSTYINLNISFKVIASCIKLSLYFHMYRFH